MQKLVLLICNFKVVLFGGIVKKSASFCLVLFYKKTFLNLDILGIGRSVAFPGHPLGSGLTPEAAKARIFIFYLHLNCHHKYFYFLFKSHFFSSIYHN